MRTQRLSVWNRLPGALLALAFLPSIGSAQSASRAPAQHPAAAGDSAGKGSAVREPSGEVALGGYCPVCIVASKEWVKGSPAIQADFDGKSYQFPAEEQKQMFLAAPANYAPALGGDDIVAFGRSSERNSGQLNLAVRYKERLYLFATPQNRAEFQQNPAAFADADLALNGECVVCRVNMQQRVAGKPEFTTVYGGIRYQFPSEEQRAMFVAAPETYTPAATAVPAGSGTRAGSGSRPVASPPRSGSGAR